MSTEETKPAEETEAQVEEIIVQIVDGRLHTIFKGKEIIFHPLTLRDTSALTRLKGQRIRELTVEGRLINESMVEPLVAKRTLEMGIPSKILDPRVQQRWFERMFKLAPTAIVTGDKSGLIENVKDFADSLTEDEFVELGYVNAVVGLRNTLSMCTVENQVGADMLRYEMARSAKTPEGEPVWPTVEDMLDCVDADFAEITTQFRAWKSGRGLDFLAGLPRQARGSDTGALPKPTPAKSSKDRPSAGRRTKSSSAKSAK